MASEPPALEDVEVTEPKLRRAVYAGSFDPITNGHLWMIEHGSLLFDELIVAIGVNPDKRYTFSVEDRMEMLRNSVEFPNVKFDAFTNKFLVMYARECGAQFILRGIRNSADYEFEKAMKHVNSDLSRNITTVFLMPPRDLTELSSSLVKGMVGPEGWEGVVRPFVPSPVFASLVGFETARRGAKRRDLKRAVSPPAKQQ